MEDAIVLLPLLCHLDVQRCETYAEYLSGTKDVRWAEREEAEEADCDVQ